MIQRYNVSTLFLILGLSLVVFTKVQGANTKSNGHLQSINETDSLSGSRLRETATFPKPSVKITPIVTANRSGILYGDPIHTVPETYAPSISRLRGYREMIRGFREMEQDELLAQPQINPEVAFTLQAYPNPASHVVKLKVGSALAIQKVEIYDASGTLKNTWDVDAGPWQKEVLELNTGNLGSGSYTIRAYSNGIPLKPTRIIISR
ncbi:T9SS type A sorting domain-containing protein [Lunatimonas salinarum]|uniref:T9SS type A sorting domain-containing protein n=1 Tax=Lunatimonas salinarum TaxID=1774590 RepID=UPI001AE09512|nr:T9SS type A sorting domain-containing protein [Lunatimonas salinarum]